MAESHTVYGLHAVTALLERGSDRIINVWLDDERSDAKLNEIKTNVEKLGLRYDSVNKKTLEKLA